MYKKLLSISLAIIVSSYVYGQNNYISSSYGAGYRLSGVNTFGLTYLSSLIPVDGAGQSFTFNYGRKLHYSDKIGSTYIEIGYQSLTYAYAKSQFPELVFEGTLNPDGGFGGGTAEVFGNEEEYVLKNKYETIGLRIKHHKSIGDKMSLYAILGGNYALKIGDYRNNDIDLTTPGYKDKFNVVNASLAIGTAYTIDKIKSEITIEFGSFLTNIYTSDHSSDSYALPIWLNAGVVKYFDFRKEE